MRLRKTEQRSQSRVVLLSARHCGYAEKLVCQIAGPVKEPSFPAFLRRTSVVPYRRRIEQYSRQPKGKAITWYMAAASGGTARAKTDLRPVIEKARANKLHNRQKNLLVPLISIHIFGCRGFEILFRSDLLIRPLFLNKDGQPW
ncbi:MAG: hypothetical protein JWM21_924 [Acidobacteria bacterium]|nr:hypothetical protein [Acidobacteriota bacterium]